MTPGPPTVDTVRSIVATLPATSERTFSSGAPRFFVADRPFAHLKPDLRTLVVRVADEDWEALRSATDTLLVPQPRAYPRQRGHLAALDLTTASNDVVAEVLADAWLTCAPQGLAKSWLAR